MTQNDVVIKTPKFQTKIHLPEIPGSFTFKKNGKLRLDQRVKKFCLLNKCRGCFEVKVHFGIHINPNKIRYDATQNGIEIDTLNDQQKYKLSVPFPPGLQLLIPENPEAQFFCGILSAKLAIINYNKNTLIKTKKQKESDKTDDIKTETVINNKNTKKHKQVRTKNNNKKKKRNQKRKRLSLDDLNKRIAMNKEDTLPPKKKRKKVKEIQSNEMNVNDQHKLIDGLVDRIEHDIKQKRQVEASKGDDIKEYLANRAEKKRNKEQRKKELREKFFERRNAKKQHKTFRKTSTKKVRFNL